MGHSKALKLKSALTGGAYCPMMYAHSGRRKPSLLTRASARRFVLSLAQAALLPTRDSEAARPTATEAAGSRFIAAVYASRGRPRLASRTPVSFLPSFLRVGWREVLGSANCDVNHRWHYALLLVLLVHPLRKSDGGTKFHWPRQLVSSVVVASVGLGRPSFLPSFLHLMETAI